MVVSFKRSSSNNGNNHRSSLNKSHHLKSSSKLVHTNASLKTTNFTVLELNSNLTAYIKNEDMAATTTATTTKQDIAAFPAQTVATFVINNKRPTIIIYPTVSPESVVIPIVSCILGFPLLALLVICCLRRRAKLARERDRRRNYDIQDHAVSLITDPPELSAYALSEA